MHNLHLAEEVAVKAASALDEGKQRQLFLRFLLSPVELKGRDGR